MAKAKKSTAASPEAATPSAEAAPKAKATKPAGKKKAAAKPATPAAAGMPQIDTSLAAATAARLVGAKVAPAATGDATKETSAFKQLKDSMNKPAGGGINSLLNSTAGPGSKKSGLPFGGNGVKQPGRNQTFGADVKRFNVPRRTGG